MQTNKLQSLTQLIAAHVNAALALPLRFLMHLFAPVIDLLINIPVMNTIWRERRELESLTEEHINDIGLDITEVRREIKRSYFDIPCDRRIVRSHSGNAYSAKRF